MAIQSCDHIVAHGRIVNQATNNMIIHGEPLPKSCIRVAIDFAMEDTALLPIPVRDELDTIFDAVGSHVAWPKDLVIPWVDEEVL